ncbi:MAG: ATP-binding protein, partial [Candidatus Omnitrophota bacterium]
KQVLARWQYIPLLRWGMVIKVDEASVFQPIYQLRNLYIIIFFLLTLLLFAISYRVSLSISAPIEIVRSGLRIIGSGFLDHKIDIKRGDEIGELADEVNKMAGQLKGVQEKLVRSEKLAGLGKLAGMVSHELRNPLGAIRNSVYFLKMRLGGATGDEKVKKHLNILDEEVEASDRIITDTLTFGRIEEPKLVPTDINMVIQGVLGSVKIPDNIESVSELSGDVPPILLDAVQVKRVFSNLITNAIQAMPGGGKLTLSSRMVCDSSTNDKYVAVTVKDTGEGISPENLKKLFEPLFSTKTKGTGLGLVVCQNIIKGHKGRIEVESALGKGSVFTVKLLVK